MAEKENDCISFITKGDAENGLDEPVNAEEILGKVFKIEKIKPLFGFNIVYPHHLFWRTVSTMIVSSTIIKSSRAYYYCRPYLSPRIFTFYRAIRARLTT